jgi:hypothetical protein
MHKTYQSNGYTTHVRTWRECSVEMVCAEVAGHGSFHFLKHKRNSELQKSVMILVKVGTGVVSLT